MLYLITGGTGTLGKQIVRKLLENPRVKIRVYSRSEYIQWQMAQEFNNDNLRMFIGDVRDKDRLAFALRGVNYVIHCAALKQIDACSYNPWEAIRTNIDGSMNLVQEAIINNVEKVLAVSSDKAVYPINLYGATKLCMERLFLEANKIGCKVTTFSCVRFGNFMESRGNVLELWQKEWGEGKPLSITDPDMERYWIQPEEAAEFAVDRLYNMKGGEIFIPKMTLTKVIDLAGLKYPNAKVNFIGKRKHEKALEDLFALEEKVTDKGGYFQIDNR